MIKDLTLFENSCSFKELIRLQGEEWGNEWEEFVLSNISSHSSIYKGLVYESLGRVIGTCFLIEKDLPTRPELFPWIAGVYVPPEYRQLGIATSLVREMMYHIYKSRAFHKIYLFVHNFSLMQIYLELGWSFKEMDTYKDKPVWIMEWKP